MVIILENHTHKNVQLNTKFTLIFRFIFLLRSSNHGKQWTTPEVRGTVGLPWPAIVDGFYNHTPPNPHSTSFDPNSSFLNLHDNLSHYPSPHDPLHHSNLNSSHEFLQHVHAATSYIHNYGTPTHRSVKC